MTDFFSDLESELRAAHRRDAKRPLLARLRPPLPRARLALAVVSAAAVIAVVALAGPGLLDRVGDDREQTATPPVAQHGCASAEPPDDVLATLRVLRRPATALDEIPGASLALWLAEGDPAKLWGDRARLARGEGDSALLVVPALLGDSCEGPAPAGRERTLVPAACIVGLGSGEVEEPACVTLDDIRAGTPAIVIERGEAIDTVEGPPTESAGRTTVLAIVPDETTARLEVGDRVIEGSTENNVFAVSYTPKGEAEAQPRVVLGSDGVTPLRGEEVALPDSDPPQASLGLCDQRGPSRAPGSALLGALGVLTRGSAPSDGNAPGVTGSTFPPGVRGARFDHGRVVELAGEHRLTVVPVEVGCQEVPREPGVCIGRIPANGRVDMACVGLTALRESGLLVREGRVAFGLMPNGVREVTVRVPVGADGPGSAGSEQRLTVTDNVFAHSYGATASYVTLAEGP